MATDRILLLPSFNIENGYSPVAKCRCRIVLLSFLTPKGVTNTEASWLVCTVFKKNALSESEVYELC